MYDCQKNKLPKREILLTTILVSGVALLFPHPALADGYIAGFLYTFVVNVFGTFAGWAGTILNFTINEMVIGFGQLYLDKGLGFTVDALWVVVRDIFNLTFIFGLVFIGLRMIFDSSNSNTRKMLISLMLAALFVNFSLYITKVVVDFANIATVQLVNAFPETPPGSGDRDISGSFAQIAGNPSFFEPSASAEVFEQFKGGGGYGYIFGMMVLLVLQTFVFFAGAILLMIRFAVLTIYMILSPLMFLGFVFPSAMGISKEYWSGFLGRAFFAPAYILMLYLSQKVLSGFQVVGMDGKSLAQSLADPTKMSIEAVLPPFIISAVFLIASIVIAQKMGANGASGVMSVGKMMTGKVKGYAMKTAADKTLGVAARGGARILNSDTVTRVNARLNTAPGWTGKLARAGVAGVSLGALTKRNRQSIIQGSNNLSIAGSQSLAARQKEDRDIRTTDARVLTAAKTQATIDAGMNSEQQLADIRARIKAGTHTPADLTALPGLEKIEQDMISAIAGLAISDLEKLSPKDWTKYGPHLTTSQLESVMKSDNIDQTSKNNIVTARQTAIENVIGTTGAIITKELTKLTIDQIETMGDDWIRDNVHLFSNSQMDELKKSKKFVPSQRENFIAERKNWHKAAVAGTTYKGTSPNVEDLFWNKDGGGTFTGERKAEDIANLGPDVLLDPTTTPLYMTDAALEVIGKKNTLSPAERSQLKRNLLATPGPNFAKLDAYLRSPDGLKYFV